MLPLESALEGRVTEECLSLYSVDGSMCKTMKSNLLDQFDFDPVAQEPDNYVSIVDMGMIWWTATPTSKEREAKKRDGSKYCWKNYLEKKSLCAQLGLERSSSLIQSDAKRI